MAGDDLTDDAIKQGEPPFRSHPAPEAAPTKKPVPAAAVHPAMLILIWSLRVVAVLIAAWASLGAFFAYMFRFDSTDEFEMVKQADVEFGGLFALAVVLFFVPGRIKKPVQCILILGVAVLVWIFVSWNLLAHHEWGRPRSVGALIVEGSAAESTAEPDRDRVKEQHGIGVPGNIVYQLPGRSSQS